LSEQGQPVSNTASWQDSAGRWHEFDVARARRHWLPIGGIYMFVKPGDYPTMEAHGPVALYIAQTHSFAEALARHSYWAAAESLGASEIHLLVLEDAAQRAALEHTLIQAQTPLLNQSARKVA
jgi:hypothetical protein